MSTLICRFSRLKLLPLQCQSRHHLKVPVNNVFLECKYSTQTKQPEGWVYWKGIVTKFIPVGICLVAVMQWRALRKHQHIAKNWEVNCYCALPLRSLSRMWGWLADKQLPENVRPIIYKLYADTFNVNLSEALYEDLKLYPSLADFFSRALKDGARQIDHKSCIVSPCDGTVLHFGKVTSGQVEQVKGVTYPLHKFLGENNWNKCNKEETDYCSSSLVQNKNNSLYQCIIYLAPGDYHRFHSPVEWQPTHRRHFPGELLSVNPKVANWLPGLFCLNERAVYVGQWKYGFFSFSAVGATNVGSVRVYFDKALQTNRPKGKYSNRDKFLGTNIQLQKGDLLGEFRMGSTIVLIFEAPSDFKFSLNSGQRVKMGQSIGWVSKLERVQKS